MATPESGSAPGNKLVTLNQLKETKDRLSNSISKSVAAEATERQRQDGVLESSIATKLGTHSVIAGNNVTVTPDDTAHTVTISADAGAYELPPASASTLGGVKIGSGISVTNDGTISASGVDTQHPGKGMNSVAIGNSSSAPSEGNIAIGYNATVPGDEGAGGNNSIAIGYGASAKALDSVAIGMNALTHWFESTAIGVGARASQNSTALGSGASAWSFNSVAIGSHAKADVDNSIAIGERSEATEKNTFSIGWVDSNGDRFTRRIVNVGTPTADTDAATKAYVDNNMPSIATSSKAGIVKPGTGINVASDGTISVQSGSGGSYTLPAATASTLGGVKVGKYLSVANDGTISRDYADFETSNYALSITDAIFCDADGNQIDEQEGCVIFKDGPLLESFFGAFIKPSKEITINGEFCTFNYSVPTEPNYGQKYGGYITEGTVAIFEILGYKIEENTAHIQFNKKLVGTGYAESIIEYHADGKIAVLLNSNELLEANKIYQISFTGKGFSPDIDIANDSSKTEGEQS